MMRLDLDLGNIYVTRIRAIRKPMEEIGFHEEGRYFMHPDSEFFVEFPPGFLTVGEEPVRQIDEISVKLSGGTG